MQQLYDVTMNFVSNVVGHVNPRQIMSVIAHQKAYQDEDDSTDRVMPPCYPTSSRVSKRKMVGSTDSIGKFTPSYRTNSTGLGGLGHTQNHWENNIGDSTRQESHSEDKPGYQLPKENLSDLKYPSSKLLRWYNPEAQSLQVSATRCLNTTAQKPYHTKSRNSVDEDAERHINRPSYITSPRRHLRNTLDGVATQKQLVLSSPSPKSRAKTLGPKQIGKSDLVNSKSKLAVTASDLKRRGRFRVTTVQDRSLNNTRISDLLSAYEQSLSSSSPKRQMKIRYEKPIFDRPALVYNRHVYAAKTQNRPLSTSIVNDSNCSPPCLEDSPVSKRLNGSADSKASRMVTNSLGPCTTSSPPPFTIDPSSFKPSPILRKPCLYLHDPIYRVETVSHSPINDLSYQPSPILKKTKSMDDAGGTAGGISDRTSGRTSPPRRKKSMTDRTCDRASDRTSDRTSSDITSRLHRKNSTKKTVVISPVTRVKYLPEDDDGKRDTFKPMVKRYEITTIYHSLNKYKEEEMESHPQSRQNLSIRRGDYLTKLNDWRRQKVRESNVALKMEEFETDTAMEIEC